MYYIRTDNKEYACDNICEVATTSRELDPDAGRPIWYTYADENTPERMLTKEEQEELFDLCQLLEEDQPI